MKTLIPLLSLFALALSAPSYADEACKGQPDGTRCDTDGSTVFGQCHEGTCVASSIPTDDPASWNSAWSWDAAWDRGQVSQAGGPDDRECRGECVYGNISGKETTCNGIPVSKCTRGYKCTVEFYE